MAYNKDNYEHNRLTPAQEEFCQQIAQGKSQRQAYYVAYPNSKNWADENAVDSSACQLMNNPKVKQRLEELRSETREKATWTRQQALDTISYVMALNKRDMDRIERAYQDEIDLLEAQLMELAAQVSLAKTPQQTYGISKQMQEITAQIAKAKKQRRANAVNIHGVYEGAKILNRMFGYDVTKVEIKQDDADRDELNKLSADELKQVLAQVGDN